MTKFVGRQIRHKRCPTNSQTMKWYTGTVLDVLRSKDGDPDAVFEILYKREQQPHEEDNVVADYQKGLLQFKDI